MILGARNEMFTSLHEGQTVAMSGALINNRCLRESRQRRRELVRALARHAKPSTYKGLFWFLKNQLVYWACLAGTLIAAPLAARLVFGMAAGFSLGALREPAPSPEAVARHPELEDCSRIPYFLLLAF